MTKQDEQTKHLKDASHMLSQQESVSNVLACAFTKNLMELIIWWDFRGKFYSTKGFWNFSPNSLSSFFFSFMSLIFPCNFNSSVFRALTKGDVNMILAKESTLLKSNESHICCGGNRPRLCLVEVFLILQCEGEVFILPGLLLKPHWYWGYVLPTI